MEQKQTEKKTASQCWTKPKQNKHRVHTANPVFKIRFNVADTWHQIWIWSTFDCSVNLANVKKSEAECTIEAQPVKTHRPSLHFQHGRFMPVMPVSCLSLIHTPPHIFFPHLIPFTLFVSLSPTYPPSFCLCISLSRSILNWKRITFSAPCHAELTMEKLIRLGAEIITRRPSLISPSLVSCALHWRTKQIDGSYGD